MNDMDHVTKQAVAQLAEQIGVPLRAELENAFAKSLEHVESFRRAMQEIADSMGVSREELRLSSDSLLEKIEAARHELETATANFGESAQALRGGFFNKLDERITKLEQNSKNIVHSLGNEISSLSTELCNVEAALTNSSENLIETQKKLEDTTCGLQKEIEDWSGLLKSSSHAHSKELDALSSELSELFSSTRARILESVEEQVNFKDNRVRQDVAELNIKLAKRLKRMEYVIWSIVAVCGIMLVRVFLV